MSAPKFWLAALLAVVAAVPCSQMAHADERHRIPELSAGILAELQRRDPQGHPEESGETRWEEALILPNGLFLQIEIWTDAEKGKITRQQVTSTDVDMPEPSTQFFWDEDADGLGRSRGDSFGDGMVDIATSGRCMPTINDDYLAALLSFHVYLTDPEVTVPGIQPDDAGARFPGEIPAPGLICWKRLTPGLEKTSLDVFFRGRLVDRIHLVRIDPDKHRIDVHYDGIHRTIEQWRDEFDAVVVVNGSYFAIKPYGEPITPTQSYGRRLDPLVGYRSTHGALLASPRVRGAPGAVVESYGPASVDVDSLLDQASYTTAVFSYPILMDRKGGSRPVNRPLKRATRTFVAQEHWRYILLGNTEGGFFSLHRLGEFLRDADTLNLKVALNLDGGPPACMAIKAGDCEYVNYGIWESAPTAAGVETVTFNLENRQRWPIPIVISVR